MAKMDWENPLRITQALVGLYQYQTADEQLAGVTVYDNGVGFNGVDSPFLTSVAEQISKKEFITTNQITAVGRVLRKYQNQIDSIDLDAVEFGKQFKIVDNSQPTKAKSKMSGRLYMAKNRSGDFDQLVFKPYIYPSKQIGQAGFAWDKVDKVWQSLFSIDKVEAVYALFGKDKIETDGSVTESMAEAVAEVALPELVEEHKILFPFQKESVAFLLGSNRALLALAPGLGKTACSIFAVHSLPANTRVLVIAPLTLLRNWQNEIGLWIEEDATIWHGKPSTWDNTEGLLVKTNHREWFVTNYDTVVRNIEAIEEFYWDVIIIDESIMVKNRKAKRTQILNKFARNVKRVWLLSGAPVSRFYDDLYAQFAILDYRRFRSYWRFAESVCHIDNNGWGASITANREGADKMVQKSYKDIFFARTQDQVLDLPDWIIENIEVEMHPIQAGLYRQMSDDFFAALPDDDDTVLAPNVLSQLTRLIQIASNPQLAGLNLNSAAKWDAVENLLEFESLPAIVWTNYIKTAQSLAERLGKKFKVATLTGSTKQEDRQEIVDAFQAGELDVIVAHPGVGKFGLTLTAARTAIYLERSYNADDYYQSLHRVRRIGTEHSPHVIHLLSVYPKTGGRTVDHIIDSILEYRRDSAVKITSGILKEYGA